MVARTWCSRRQTEFLDSREDDFSAAQENGTLSKDFWPKLTGEFLAIWPNQQAEEADWDREASEEAPNGPEKEGIDKDNAPKSKRRRKPKKARVVPVFASHADWEQDRIKKLRVWFYNHTSKDRKVKPAVTLTFNAAPALGSKALTEDQLYSRKYYKERVKLLVDAELASSAVGPKDHMAIRARITRECYEREPEEVKDEIRREKAEEDRKRRETMELLQSLTRIEDGKEPSPEEYARYQGAAADLAVCFFDALAARTGWAWTVLGGGPHSDKVNGANGVVSYHVGATPDGLKFRGAVESFDEHYAVPFGKYCHRIFPEEVRLRRAVKISADMAGRESLQRAGRRVGTLVYVDAVRPVNEGGSGVETNEEGDGGKGSGDGLSGSSTWASVDVGTAFLTGDHATVAGETAKEDGGDPLGETAGVEGPGVGVDDDGGWFQGADAPPIGDDVGCDMVGVQDNRVLDRFLASLPPISPFAAHDPSLVPPPQMMFPDALPGCDGLQDVVLPPGEKTVDLGLLPPGEKTADLGLLPPGDDAGVMGRDVVEAMEDGLQLQGDAGRMGEGPETVKLDDVCVSGKKRVNDEVDGGQGVGREKRSRRGGVREVDDWVLRAEGYLGQGIDDADWTRCVALWSKLEKTAVNRNSRLTESGLRPVELSKWVSARKWDGDPIIADLHNYAVRWIAWWRAMQPACRKVDGRDLPADVDERMKPDMLCLKKAGPNGLVVLLVGLKWWAPLRVEDGRWGDVVGDLARCLELFVG
ncbi:hypothetical protein MD484_g8291, partial [Candolleomyces efflorescens]